MKAALRRWTIARAQSLEVKDQLLRKDVLSLGQPLDSVPLGPGDGGSSPTTPSAPLRLQLATAGA